MFSVQRDHAEDIHVLIKNDKLRRRLDVLLRIEPEHWRPRYSSRKALRRRIIDTSLVEGLEDFLRSPRLVRRAFASGGPVVGPEHGGRVRILSAATDTQTCIGCFPASADGTAALPDSG